MWDSDCITCIVIIARHTLMWNFWKRFISRKMQHWLCRSFSQWEYKNGTFQSKVIPMAMPSLRCDIYTPTGGGPTCWRTLQEAHLMVCNTSWHVPGCIWCISLLALYKKGDVDLSMDTLHLKYPFVLFGFEGSAFTLPLFLYSLRIVCSVIVLQHQQRTTFCKMLWHLMTFVFQYAFNTHSFITCWRSSLVT